MIYKNFDVTVGILQLLCYCSLKEIQTSCCYYFKKLFEVRIKFNLVLLVDHTRHREEQWHNFNSSFFGKEHLKCYHRKNKSGTTC